VGRDSVVGIATRYGMDGPVLGGARPFLNTIPDEFSAFSNPVFILDSF